MGRADDLRWEGCFSADAGTKVVQPAHRETRSVSENKTDVGTLADGSVGSIARCAQSKVSSAKRGQHSR